MQYPIKRQDNRTTAAAAATNAQYIARKWFCDFFSSSAKSYENWSAERRFSWPSATRWLESLSFRWESSFHIVAIWHQHIILHTNLHTQMMHFYSVLFLGILRFSHQINWNKHMKKTKQNRITLDIGTCKHLKFSHPSIQLSINLSLYLCVFCAHSTRMENMIFDQWYVKI